MSASVYLHVYQPEGISLVSEKLQAPSRIDQVLVLVNLGRDCNPMRRFWSPGARLELPVDTVLVWGRPELTPRLQSQLEFTKTKAWSIQLGDCMLFGFGKLGDGIAIPAPISNRWDSGLHFGGLRCACVAYRGQWLRCTRLQFWLILQSRPQFFEMGFGIAFFGGCVALGCCIQKTVVLVSC